MPVCKLCLQDKLLIKKSHIIPDFMYKHSGMYNEHHKIHSFTLKDLLDKKRPSMISTGEYEGNILCADCDGIIIGSYENYGKQVIFGGTIAGPIPECNHFIDEGLKFTICTNVDYKNYKLFLLSILWRMSISSRETFKFVNLGKESEEHLRSMILDGNPKAFYDYPIFTGHFIKDQSVPKDLIVQPVQTKENDRVILILAGFIHVFETDSKKYENSLEELRNTTISEEGKIFFYELEEGMTMNFIKRMSGI